VRRRTVLLGAGVAVGAGVAGLLSWRRTDEAGHRASVAAVRATAYDGKLVAIIRDGLAAIGVGREWVAGKSVLLKPNLVEPSFDAPHVNTHPTFVRAVATVFRRWDAREVMVAEGPGHQRDTDLVLEQSGLGQILDEERLPFVDLNRDEVFTVPNRLGFSKLKELHLPRTLRRCDLIVSLPKMKTHHWVGVTLSMKNLFGLMPGNIYGWPKNVLHHAGIPHCILDITAAVRPHLCIVDGIIGMEGDGPIMGRPKPAGVIVLGQNPTAVDATAARIMGLEPQRIDYLKVAAGRLGPIRAAHIEQRGEPLAGLRQPFQLLHHPLMKHFTEG
jgi:uncharacterized protein (DUF362 family)